MYPVFGIRGASWFLGVSGWLFGTLLFLGFWNKLFLGSGTSAWESFGSARIDCYVPHDGHHHSVHAEWLGPGGRLSGDGRQPSLPGEDIVLLAASIYLLKQDVVRLLEAERTVSVAFSHA